MFVDRGQGGIARMCLFCYFLLYYYFTLGVSRAYSNFTCTKTVNVFNTHKIQIHT